MMKNASGKSILTFPYKSFTAECGKAIDLWETGPSTVKSFSEYYAALWEEYKEEIIKAKGGGEIDIRYLAFVPLKIIDRLNSRSESLQKYVRFFLGHTDEKPKYPLVDMYEVDSFERILLEDITYLKGTFSFMAEGKLRTRQNPREGCYDNDETFISELDFAFVQYMRQYELMGDDAVWNLTFKLKKIWRDLIWAMLDIAFDRVESEAPFDAIHADLRAAFQGLPQALYRLECRRYQELSKETGTSVYRPPEKKKNDMRGDCTLNDIQNKMCDMHRDVKEIKRDVKGGFARNDDYARQQRLSVPPDLSGDRRGKWAQGWRGKMVDEVFKRYNNGSGRPFDNICHEVYAENVSDFNKKRIAYNSFKRACDRQKNHRKDLT